MPVAAGLNKLGTIWIVSHESRRSFDAEDTRLISSIAAVAGAVLGQRRLQLETEEALRAARHSQQFTERVLGSSHDCIKFLDAKGNILFRKHPLHE